MKVLSYILCAVILMQTMVIDTSVKIFAEERAVITGFEELAEAERIYCFNKEEKPDLESLLKLFPETIEGYVDNAEKITLPVNWYSVGEDYAEEDSYYFQFSPAWDEMQFPVLEDFDILRDAPYIAVFLSDEDVSSKSVTGRGNETVIYEFLRSEMGLNIAAACGVLANIYHESSFNPNAVGDKGTSYGICQWHNERWDAMKSWCEKNGYDWTTLEGQLYYLKFELSQNNSNYLWNGKTIYNYISHVSDTPEGAYEAGRYWCFYYEVPANRDVVSVTRGNLAQNVYWAEYGYVDQEPIGYCEEITGGVGGVRVLGWAYDPDVVDETVVIQVFVDDAHIVDVVANQLRPDVNEEYASGDYHGFEAWVSVPIAGIHTVTLYAVSTAFNEVVSILGSAIVSVAPVTENKDEEEVVETVQMYRLYNPNSGEHFYTGSEEELDNLMDAGWQYEGVAWNAPISSGIPVHRLYNPNSGDHHYTMSQEESDMLVSVGWQYEGIAWNSASADKLPLYRLYNPNADCGSHHYTASEEERDFLVSVGWEYEGIGWFGE